MALFRRNTIRGETVTGVEARAGFLDRPVLVVLTVSMVLIASIFGAMLFGFGEIDAEPTEALHRSFGRRGRSRRSRRRRTAFPPPPDRSRPAH